MMGLAFFAGTFSFPPATLVEHLWVCAILAAAPLYTISSVPAGRPRYITTPNATPPLHHTCHGHVSTNPRIPWATVVRLHDGARTSPACLFSHGASHGGDHVIFVIHSSRYSVQWLCRALRLQVDTVQFVTPVLTRSNVFPGLWIVANLFICENFSARNNYIEFNIWI